MRELKTLTGRRVVICGDGLTVRGVIESATRAFVTVVDAVDVESPSRAPISGAVLIPASRVRYVQVVI